MISVDKMGKTSFLESEDWPVSETEYRNLYNTIYIQYFSLLKKLNREDYYIGIVESNFLNYIIQVLHYNYVKIHAKKNNLKLYHTSLSETFLNPNWQKSAKFYKKFSYPYNKIQRIIRRFIKVIYFNRHLSFYKILMNLVSKKKIYLWVA